MAYYFRLEGFGEIKCDTIEDLRAAVGKNAGAITDVSVDRLRRAGAGRPPKRVKVARDGKSPGVGPARSWTIAEWYSVKTGMIKNDARAALTKMKKESPRKHLDLVDEFEKLVQWYAGKSKSPSVEVAKEALRSLYADDIEQYKAMVHEFDKRTKGK